jgi:diguanylate cyclase (GGDEF)-like protein/PAS domain S-box-containing protein
LKREIEERMQAEERLALAQRAGRVGVFDIDLIRRKVVWTGQMEELFGLRPGAFEGGYEDWARRVHPDDLPRLEEQLRMSLHEGFKQVDIEYRCIRADGQVRWMAVTAQVDYSHEGSPVRMIGTNVDITERKKLEEDIIRMAHHDFLTGLPNRLLFRNIVDQEVAQARRAGHKLALFFLDLDRFKEVNDTFGHDAGDEMLKQVSRRVKDAIRESDTVARIGGDEFNIMLTDITRPEDVTIIGRKILDSMKKPLRVAGYELLTTASMGISIYPDDSSEIETLYRYADIAMYHAKMQGRNNFQFYNTDINVRSVERIRLESMLRQTIDRGELVVFYQPQVDIHTRKMVCAEALVRWRHPERGLLEPKHFIPAAEEIGFITAIDEHVLRTACAQIRSWQCAGLIPVCVTVNLSARAFDDTELVKKVAQALEETAARPEYLDVEITESLAMRNIHRTVNRLDELAEIGVHASIDDFGTGYSSLNYLKRLSIRKLKIDQSFIRDIASDDDDKAIISAVTVMAHTMRINVVAEGVETEDQLKFLRTVRCDQAQGYLFSEALPAEEFEKLLASAES